jgi:hypothetical protein
MLLREDIARTDVSEGRIACIIRVTRIRELGTKLAVISNRNTLQAIRPSEMSVLNKSDTRVTSQKTAFFIVTAVETSNVT